MAVNICIYEDTHFDQFYPLTYFRPVFLLRPGILPLFEQTKLVFTDCAISFSCRTQISSLIGDEARNVPVNIIKKSQG
ncbi:MAG: putative sugar nucleotidyl transferase, partial [candidate division Zixibacteria bacterium]